jgi:hypothetical protein
VGPVVISSTRGPFPVRRKPLTAGLRTLVESVSSRLPGSGRMGFVGLTQPGAIRINGLVGGRYEMWVGLSINAVSPPPPPPFPPGGPRGGSVLRFGTSCAKWISNRAIACFFKHIVFVYSIIKREFGTSLMVNFVIFIV